MKKWYHFVFAALTLLFLLGYLAYDRQSAEKQEDIKDQESLVFQFDLPMVEEVDIKTKHAELTLKVESKNDAGDYPDKWDWAIVKPFETPASNLEVRSSLAALADIKITTTVSDQANRLAVFGLDDSSKPTTIVLKGKAGKHRKVIIGSKNPDETGNYALIDDGKKVYLIEQRLHFLNNKKFVDFRLKTPFVFTRNEVSQVSYEWPGEAPIVVDKDVQKGNWNLREPFVAKAHSGNITNLFGEMGSVTLDKIISEDQATVAASQYGFDKPTATIRLTLKPEGEGQDVAEQVYSVILGQETLDKKARYVRTSDRETVYQFKNSQLERIKKDLSYFISSELGDFTVGEIDEVVIEKPIENKKQVLTRKDGQWQIKISDKHYLVDRRKVRTFLRELRTLNGDEFLRRQPEKEDGFGTPKFVFSVRDNQNNVHSYSLSERPATKGSKEVFKLVRGGSDNFVFKVVDGVYKKVIDAANTDFRQHTLLNSDIETGKIELTIVQDKKKVISLETANNNGKFEWVLSNRHSMTLKDNVSPRDLFQAFKAIEIQEFLAEREGLTPLTLENAWSLVIDDQSSARDSAKRQFFIQDQSGKWLLYYAGDDRYAGFHAYLKGEAMDKLKGMLQL